MMVNEIQAADNSPLLQGGVDATINKCREATNEGSGRGGLVNIEGGQTTPSARNLGFVYARSHPSSKEGTIAAPYSCDSD